MIDKLKNEISDIMSQYGVEEVDFGDHKLKIKPKKKPKNN